MPKPFVTIAIPTYNRAKSYLGETLNSAVAQNYENIEILISDNASTDHTEDFVKMYADPRIRYIKQEKNLGQRGNSNFLLQEARGDYFLMLHDDDRIDHDFVETCMEAAEFKKGIGILMTGSRVINERGEVLRSNKNRLAGLSIEDVILNWYRCNVNIFLCCTLFGTTVLREIGGFEDMYNHYDDVAANFKCSERAGRVDIGAAKSSFRHHSEAVTMAADVLTWAEDSLTLLELAKTIGHRKRNEIEEVGLKQSASNVYMYSSLRDTKLQKLYSYWKTYKFFNYKFLPGAKYCNQVVPGSGYFLHPYNGLSKLKSHLVS